MMHNQPEKTMKHVLTFIFLLALAGTVSAGQSDTLRVKTRVYCDHCTKCGSCWPKIERELTFSPGIKGLSFDEKAMLITVIYNPKKTTPENIRTAISGSGFDADDVKADPKAQGKLDGCCKKPE